MSKNIGELSVTKSDGLAYGRVWAAAFLAAFSQMGNVTQAAKIVGIARKTAYELRNDDPEFAKAWEEAEQEAADILEAEAWRRAVDGYERPVYQAGGLVGTVREYSDTLMTTLLRAHKKDKYRESKEITGKDGGPILTRNLSDDALMAIASAD